MQDDFRGHKSDKIQQNITVNSPRSGMTPRILKEWKTPSRSNVCIISKKVMSANPRIPSSFS